MHSLSIIALLSIFICQFTIDFADSAKILSLAFVTAKSHKITYEPLLRELASRNHEITIISSVRPSKIVHNIREIFVVDFDEEFSKLGNIFEMTGNGTDITPLQAIEIFRSSCEKTYDAPEVQQLLNEKFDLIIVEAFYNDCAYGLIYKLNTTLIILSPLTAPSWVTGILGGTSPPSFVPNVLSGWTDRMSFIQRVINFFSEISLRLVKKFYFDPIAAEIYRRKLNDSTIPEPDEILKNASLVISNSHFSTGSPQIFLPDVIEANGMHIREAKPLPQDLEDFVKTSGDDGFILFSMGSALRGSTMPEDKRKMFVRAFAKLKQTVLWKWETETMPDLPTNVKLSKWLPQQDILGHPKLKAFITHGGYGSITESVYHGVPVIGIPMFVDQFLNMQRAESRGFAITIQYIDVTEENLLDALDQVIKEPRFKQNVMKLSNILRDQPNKPLDRAIFWVEYILRHKGALHLRSAGRDLNSFQYYSLDVIGFLLGVCLLLILIIWKTLRLVFKRLRSSIVNSEKKNN